jgi:GntR family transcriptional regulator
VRRYDMHIILNNSSMVPIYEQLMEQIKNGILTGKLSANEALPSVRTLSSELKISALTVKKAYDCLEEEGFVITVHGKGTFVAPTDRQLALEARKKAVEDDFFNAIQKARAVGMSNEEIREIVNIMLED